MPHESISACGYVELFDIELLSYLYIYTTKQSANYPEKNFWMINYSCGGSRAAAVALDIYRMKNIKPSRRQAQYLNVESHKVKKAISLASAPLFPNSPALSLYYSAHVSCIFPNDTVP